MHSLPEPRTIAQCAVANSPVILPAQREAIAAMLERELVMRDRQTNDRYQQQMSALQDRLAEISREVAELQKYLTAVRANNEQMLYPKG